MWPHAVRHATVARNRVLTKVADDMWVPLERWLGKKPPVDMLRVFGCMAVAHVPKPYRTKLGASALWCVHLGLAAESKGWLLWEPSKNVLFDSRDVKFVENIMLVAKGFQQKEKEDYKEVFAPTAKSPTLRVLLAVAAVRKWKVKQMDIVTAFLYGIVEEEVYMVQPPGYEDGTGRVCKLNKAIYGLKQAPRCWYNRLASALEGIGFRASACDESLFLMGEGESLVLLLVYVDDILLFSSSDKEIDGVQRKLTEQFKCKSLGEARYYLGMHIERDTERGWLKLHQGQYINTLAEKYSLQEEREVVTPLPSEFKLIKAAEGEGMCLDCA
ncbi:hypothetical protein CLOP_g2150 [Closterium sp. NIES-67]|nr:hypothetical protein CLOP_g2150 [Closterium sp. NIES-67]